MWTWRRSLSEKVRRKRPQQEQAIRSRHSGKRNICAQHVLQHGRIHNVTTVCQHCLQVCALHLVQQSMVAGNFPKQTISAAPSDGLRGKGWLLATGLFLNRRSAIAAGTALRLWGGSGEIPGGSGGDPGDTLWPLVCSIRIFGRYLEISRAIWDCLRRSLDMFGEHQGISACQQEGFPHET